MAEVSAEDRPAYLLNRDFLASARLTYQHNIYTERMGYLLHPDITSSFGLGTKP